MYFASEPLPRRIPGRAPSKFTVERQAAYLVWLEKTGSHQLASTSPDVRLDPEFTLAEIRKDPELGRLAQLARRNYSHRLLTAIEQRVAAGQQLDAAAVAVLRAHGGRRYRHASVSPDASEGQP